MNILAIIPARAGSKGLPGKCVAPLAGRPLIEHTIAHARAARRVTAVCVSTDSPDAADVARRHGICVIERPAELATDTAPVDAALRHAVEAYERGHPGFRADVIVLLYANIPIRSETIIDAAIERLLGTGADSVRSLAPVGKHHPDWLHRLDGDRMAAYRPNLIHRRQDLEPLYYHDGAVVALTRAALYAEPSGPDDHHAFFGKDRRGIVQPPDASVDIDAALDLHIAQAVLAARRSGSAGPAIGGRAIGPGQPPYVIAEAGVNHDGDVATARKLVAAAREAGADAVKFQVFAADRLVGAGGAACEYQRQHTGAKSQRDMLRQLELRHAAFEELQSVANDAGIHFLATPFGVEEARFLARLGVPAIKLASTDLTNVPLITSAVAANCPLIMSTGAADAWEVAFAVDLVSRLGAEPRLALLHCVSRYPTPLAAANLAAIRTLREQFGRPTGFSDHTAEVETAGLAVAAGAVLLEKHLTLDRSRKGPDHFFSLTPADFAAYVRSARRAAEALGSGRIACETDQRETRHLARGSIIAKSHIACGTAVRAADLSVQRPGGGIDPMHWERVVGRAATRDIRAGERVEWSMLGIENESASTEM